MNGFTYPVAELFTSPQGEGLHSGLLMTFCRLAGCNVGKPFSKEAYQKGGPAFLLPTYMEECHTIDGRSFACDTNFKSKQKLSSEEILKQVPEGVSHFCITGGEPMMHNLDPLLDACFSSSKITQVHIETSGTKLPSFTPKYGRDIWITCSPKLGALPAMIRMADEIKLLIDEDFDPTKLPKEILQHKLIWAQPINNERSVRKENVERVMAWQLKYPNWRISLQLHKVLETFTERRVL